MDKIQKEPMIKQERGITLIALIITIIVLLILAGVSIAMLTGKNGILSKAEDTEYNQAQAELTEEIILSMTESVMETMTTDDHEHTISKVLNIAKNNGYINDDEHTIVVLGTNGVEEETETTIENVSEGCTKAKVIHNQTGAFVIITMLENGSIVIGDEDQGTGNGTESDSESGENNQEDKLTIPGIANSGIILDKDTTFEDENGDEIVIPGGFGVPLDRVEDPLVDRDSVEEGFVIEDSKGNQFVWVPADFENNLAASNLRAVETEGTYTCTANSSYTEPKYLTSETGGDESPNNIIGLTEQDLRDEFEEMQASVVNRGGFYIMRYEMSYGVGGTAESKQGAIAAKSDEDTSYSWWGMYALAKSYTNGSIASTMIANSQYDILVGWVTDDEISSNGRNTLPTTTGTEPTDKIRNIYDLTGGGYEWTTGGFSTYARGNRGGYYSNNDSASNAGHYHASAANGTLASRSTLIW